MLIRVWWYIRFTNFEERLSTGRLRLEEFSIWLEKGQQSTSPKKQARRFVVTCKHVLEIAIRMEAAFAKRVVGIDIHQNPTPDTWMRCSSALIRFHHEEPRYPLDPELFIAVLADHGKQHQIRAEMIDLIIKLYAKVVRRMIRRLENELSEELQWLESSSDRGLPLEHLVLSPSRKLTPLSRYIHACRKNRSELAGRLISEVIKQHELCPLYREASHKWLPSLTYPNPASLDRWRGPRVSPQPSWHVSHN